MIEQTKLTKFTKLDKHTPQYYGSYDAGGVVIIYNDFANIVFRGDITEIAEIVEDCKQVIAERQVDVVYTIGHHLCEYTIFIDDANEPITITNGTNTDYFTWEAFKLFIDNVENYVISINI